MRKVRKFVMPEDGDTSGLLNTDNTYKLLMDYFGFSDTEYVHSEFDRENIFYQRWRASIKDDIENILAENWVIYFDPGASGPPLSQDEIRKRIEELWLSVKEPGDSAFELDTFKNYLIRKSIRSALKECQRLAFRIDKSFDELDPEKVNVH